MHSFKFILFTVFILLTVSVHTVANVFAQTSGLLVATNTTINMRSGPSTEFDIVTTLTTNTPVLLDGRDSTGVWLRGVEPTGFVGWISNGGLTITQSQINGLPIITVDTPFLLSPPAADAVPAPVTEGSDTGGSAETAPTPAAENPPAAVATDGGLLVLTTTRINMRGGPGTTYSVVTTLQRNTPVLLDGRDTTGVWLRGVEPTGFVGWVSNGGLSIQQAQINALPIITVDTPFVLAPPAANAVPSSSTTTNPTPAPVNNTAPVVANPITPVTSTTPVTGFSYGGHISGFNDTTVNALNRSGMTWVKVQIRYFQGQDPSGLSGLINTAHAYGFRILLGIVGQPAELNNGGYLDAYAGYVGGAAALGADAIEVWNEPNIDREWPAGQISPASYVTLLATAYNSIKANNPNTMVISGAPAPTGYFGGCTGAGCDDNLFVQGMAAAGAASYLDCVGLHYNEGIIPPSQTSGDPRGNSSHYSRYFWGMINTYTASFGRSRPLCFTELGYLSPEGYGPLPSGFAWAENVTVAQQAAWLDSAISLSRGSGRVRLVIVWNVDFTGIYGDDPMGGYAMIRPDGSCPACDALGS